LIAPMARSRLVHPDGDLGVARAAAAAGTIQVVASGSGFPLESVCPEGGGPKWFQVSRLVSWELTEHLAERAEHAGYRALVVTVDAPVSGSRERSRRDVRYSPVENALRFAPELVARPGWLYRFWRDGMPAKTPNTEGWTVSGNAIPRSARGAVNHSNAPTWAEIARLRALWSGPLLLKGILAPDDARRAEDVGANGIMVSNHGGRQLDGAPGALDALPGVVDAVGGRLEVLLDGGIRRGTDVVKALALGARAVLVGRFAMWSLAIGGHAGVERMLAILRSDLVRTMQLIGCTTVDELDGRWLFR
jgi:isopentenyl diphosphate isomerase/L-lactate dehydrogenase-like FMN-dependent dehydrogenase